MAWFRRWLLGPLVVAVLACSAAGVDRGQSSIDIDGERYVVVVILEDDTKAVLHGVRIAGSDYRLVWLRLPGEVIPDVLQRMELGLQEGSGEGSR